MTNETEFAGLLPCPFCGGEAEFKPYKKDGLTIKCKSFGCVRRDQRVLRQSIDWLREAMAKDWNTRTNPPPVDAAAERDAPDPTLLKFYQVDDYPALVAEMEGHILKLIDTHKRNVKPWEDTFPPTLLPKWIRKQEQRALVLADSWQDEAAESWGESREHATLQRCADELRAALAAPAPSEPAPDHIPGVGEMVAARQPRQKEID